MGKSAWGRASGLSHDVQKSIPVAPEAKMTIPTQTALTVLLAAMMMAPMV
jgi:hypothetical protein